MSHASVFLNIILQKEKPLNLKGFFRAIDGARTRGLDLGKVARYQLRHYRIAVTSK